MFLDVACFFNGWDIDKVEKILDSCGYATSLGKAILIERCLVTVDGGKIQMHDLLGVMGQNVVRGDYLKGVGLPSRIWLYVDFLKVLSTDMAQDKHGVKGIVLNLAKKEDCLIKPDDLMGFKNLRIFIARNVDGPEEPLRLPGELRYLESRDWPPSVEFDQSSNKIINLDLAKSRITKINGKGFKELKYLNLEECMSLTTLDEAVGSLENLVNLRAKNCWSLVEVPSLLSSKRLQTLEFCGCPKLNRLPAFKEELKFLQKLILTTTALKELPESIGNLLALERLDMLDCEYLSIIPHSIYKLQALKVLYIWRCPKLELFPRRLVGLEADVLGLPNLEALSLFDCSLKDLEFLKDLTCFQTLKLLELSGNQFACVPLCLRKFKNLQSLKLCDCRSLILVPELPSHWIRHLDLSKCFNLRTLPRLHTFIGQSTRSYEVDLSGCDLGRNFLVESLPLEEVRLFTGAASVVCTANDLPQWVNFQTTERGSHYQVSLPRNMSEDDILGLKLVITVVRRHLKLSFYTIAKVVVGGITLSVRLCHPRNADEMDAVYTWFVYIPRQPIEGYSPYEIDDWRSITFKFPMDGLEYRSLGLRMLCKREEDNGPQDGEQ